MLCAENSTFAP